MTGLGEQQHKLQLLKAEIQASTAGQSPLTPPEVVLQTALQCWLNLLQSPTQFLEFHAIYFCHTASSQFGVNSVMSEGWGRTKTGNWVCLSLLAARLTFQGCTGSHGFPLQLPNSGQNTQQVLWQLWQLWLLKTFNTTSISDSVWSFQVNNSAMLECMGLLDMSAWIQAVDSECWSVELAAYLRGTVLGTELLIFLSLVHQSSILSAITGYKNFFT